MLAQKFIYDLRNNNEQGPTLTGTKTTLHRFDVVLNFLGNIAQVKTLCNVVQEPPENIAQEKSCPMLSYYYWDNIAQVKTLCYVVRELPENITQE